jgi:hypothetical protein
MYNYEETVAQSTVSVAHAAAEAHVGVNFVSPETYIIEPGKISMFDICTADVGSYLSISKSPPRTKAQGSSSLPFALGS